MLEFVGIGFWKGIKKGFEEMQGPLPDPALDISRIARLGIG